ncbi:MAG TPA: serine/threonine-protein kinase, partial [Longimicrobiaceae bacterium]
MASHDHDPDPDRWRRLQAIVDAALDTPECDRESLLTRSCGGDPDLRAEAERLLRSCERAEAFLGQPAAELAAGLLGTEPGPVRRPAPVRIGPYRIIREAGHGGMGTVYLAERDDGQFQKRVALKLMREGADSDAVLRRFIDERQILARLDHPHIARLLDGGATTGGVPYLVMDFIEGVPIDRYCDERRLPVEARLALFVEVCRAVQYAHQNLVVHRDLKPGNILVTATGEAKLLDFGIAKLLDPPWETAEAGLTRTGMRPMTPEFASPEQLRGEPVTTASDVYALGVLLYLLLAGRHPHPGSRRSGYELERAVVEAEPVPPSAGLRGATGPPRVRGSGVRRRWSREAPPSPLQR